MAKNKVLAGAHEGADVMLTVKGKPYINPKGLFSKKIMLDVGILKGVEVVQESSSATKSSIMRGAVGAALLGPIGIAAALTGKSTSTVTLIFHNGDRSRAEIDGAILQALQNELFNSGVYDDSEVDENVNNAPTAIEQLERLAALKEKGLLTDEEFAAQKAMLLG